MSGKTQTIVWKNAEDTPEVGKQYLVADGDGGVFVLTLAYVGDKLLWRNEEGRRLAYDFAKHWAYLPSTPVVHKRTVVLDTLELATICAALNQRENDMDAGSDAFLHTASAGGLFTPLGVEAISALRHRLSEQPSPGEAE